MNRGTSSSGRARAGACVATYLLLVLAAQSALAGPVPRRSFVTSVEGSGDLSTWPESKGIGGLAGADQVCAFLADSAGLSNPGAFVAWMSDAQSDAWCRVRGLAGRRVDDCNVVGQLPGAGPWSRIDGSPFAAALDSMLFPLNEVYNPPRIAEDGLDLSAHGALQDDPLWIYTGTSESGVLGFNGWSCSNWQADQPGTTVGRASSTGAGWGAAGALTDCEASGRILCLEMGPGGPLELPEATVHPLIFVTSAAGSGNLGTWPLADGLVGRGAADRICQNSAASAGLPFASQFVALLTVKSGASDAESTAPPSADGWYRLDGFRVASNTTDLFDGMLATPVNLTETWEYTHNAWVWTGSDRQGMSRETCSEWTSGAVETSGTVGVSSMSDPEWIARPDDVSCSQFGSLYCLGPPGALFGDGFETGGTEAWTSLGR